MSIAADAFALLAQMVLFVGGVLVLGFGAWVWSRAIVAAHTARSHSITVQAQADSVDEAERALEEAEQHKQRYYAQATPEDMMESIIAERGYMSTQENEGLAEEAVVPAGGMYVREGEEEPA